jgi:prevent-host-death family protein
MACGQRSRRAPKPETLCALVALITLTMSIIEVAMITETTAVAFRQNLGEMLNIVQYRNDSVLIKKDGKPVAALIDARLFERIRRMQDRFDALANRLAEDFSVVPEDVGMAAIETASRAVRKEMKGQAKAPAAPAKKRAR